MGMKAPPTPSQQHLSQSNLRALLRQRRDALPPHLCQAHSQIICEHLLTHPFYQEANTIGAYWAIGNEVNLSAFIEQAFADGKRIALPRINGTAMQFHLYTPEHTQTNTYGITEPLDTCDVIPRSEMDAVILPLVGFDAHGHRIGMGGGFYDRYFSGQKTATAPLRLGVAYEVQRTATFAVNEWDIPPHQIISEHGQVVPCNHDGYTLSSMPLIQTSITFKTDLSPQHINAFWDAFIAEAIEANQLLFGGLNDGFIEPNGAFALTEEHKNTVRNWLNQRDEVDVFQLNWIDSELLLPV